MGILKALGSTLSAVIDVVVLPVDIVKDAVTMGGVVTDEPCATKERLESVYDKLKEACEDLGED